MVERLTVIFLLPVPAARVLTDPVAMGCPLRRRGRELSWYSCGQDRAGVIQQAVARRGPGAVTALGVLNLIIAFGKPLISAKA